MTIQADVERAIFEADDARYQAMLAGDVAQLESQLADELLYTHSSALVDTKAQYLDAMREGRTRYLVAQRKQAQVRLFGLVAVMHGHVIMQIESQSGKRDLNNLFQAVWIQRDGRWQLASWASTVIPPQAKTT